MKLTCHKYTELHHSMVGRTKVWVNKIKWKMLHSLYGLIWHRAKFHIPDILFGNEIFNLGAQLIGLYSFWTFFPLSPNSFLLLVKVAGFLSLRGKTGQMHPFIDTLCQRMFLPRFSWLESLCKQELSIRLSRTWDLRFESIWRMLQKKLPIPVWIVLAATLKVFNFY